MAGRYLSTGNFAKTCDFTSSQRTETGLFFAGFGMLQPDGRLHVSLALRQCCEAAMDVLQLGTRVDR